MSVLFAKLDSSSIVTNVIVVKDEDTDDINGNLIENVGIGFCQKLFGGNIESWKMTSDSIRGNVACPGMKYLTNQATLGVGSTDIFIEEKPFTSWVLDSAVAKWKAPTPPGDEPALTSEQEEAHKHYIWNESNYNANPTTAWVLTDP
jgi:hypothetical protein